MENEIEMEVIDHIGYYLGALNNKYRLAIMLLLEKNKKLSFTEIHKKLVENGLILSKPQLAYHLGILTSARLVTNRYQRKNKTLTEYKLSQIGKKVLEIAKKTMKIKTPT
ncbi:MAG: hypothetical protein ACP6IP_09625 [Candidatus Njordarchaeia archaeon]